MEVKEGLSCDLGYWNQFTTKTVSVDKYEPKLQFKKGDDGWDGWEGSEVRVILPEEEMPYTYGTYSFSIKSVSVLDSVTSAVIDTVLPQSQVLRLYTWDDTGYYADRENWNHGARRDIALEHSGRPRRPILASACTRNPQLVRFCTGVGSSYAQEGHIYEFTWNPGKVTWYTDAAGGKNHSYYLRNQG